MSDVTAPPPAFSELQQELVRQNSKVQLLSAELHKLQAEISALRQMLEERYKL